MRSFIITFFILLGLLFPALSAAAIPASERAVLTNLYASTNGDASINGEGWTTRTNWNSAVGTECSWYGVTCDSAESHVTGIDLRGNWGNNLVGTLPSFSGLTALQTLDVSFNKLTGSISSLSGLTALQTFSVGWNQLTGSIPSLSGLTALQYFNVRGNQLTGSIPSLSGLTALIGCYVYNNQLTGSVPAPPTSLLANRSNLCGNSLTTGGATIDAAWVTAQSTEVTYGGVAGGNWLACQIAAVPPVCILTASSPSISAGGTSTLTASCSPAATSYLWVGGTCVGTSSSCSVTPSATTTYTVAGVNSAGSGAVAAVTVTVNSTSVPASGTAAAPKFAYVTNFDSGNVSVYTINQTTGALTAGTAVAAGTKPTSVTVDPSGRFAYVTNAGSNDVFGYTINQTTGALTLISSVSAVMGTEWPHSITVDPSGRFVYVAYVRSNGAITCSAGSFVVMYTINQTTGALTDGTAVAADNAPASVTIDPSGRFAYVVNVDCTSFGVPVYVSVYTIDQTTGKLYAVTSVAVGHSPSGVAVDPSGRFAYVASGGSSPDYLGTVSVYTINQTTGALTAGSTVAAGAQSSSVTVDPSGRFAYVTNCGSNTVGVYTINQTTGALTGGTAVAAGSCPFDATVDPSGRFAYVANWGSNNVSVYMINQTTGALTGGTAVAAGTSPNSVTTTAGAISSNVATSQTISFGSAPAITVGGTGTVSATATSGLPVTYSSLTLSICYVSGSTVTGVTAGTCTIAANQAGNATYNAANQVTQLFSIGTAVTPPSCTLTTSPTSISAGGTSLLTASCSPTATSYLWVGGSCSSTSSSCSVTPSATTIYTVAGVNSAGSGTVAAVTVTVAPLGSILVVEFYNTNLDNYFITADANEAAQIDGGAAGSGWIRTGNSFKSGGSTSVCRFYGSYSPGPNSHFYTVDPAECQGLKNQQFPAGDPRKLTIKSWNFESLDFVSTPATNQTCPTGTTPVYRAYNNGFARGVDSNHRITSSTTAIQEVVTRGWSNEGVVMCSPN